MALYDKNISNLQSLTQESNGTTKSTKIEFGELSPYLTIDDKNVTFDEYEQYIEDFCVEKMNLDTICSKSETKNVIIFRMKFQHYFQYSLTKKCEDIETKIILTSIEAFNFINFTLIKVLLNDKNSINTIKNKWIRHDDKSEEDFLNFDQIAELLNHNKGFKYQMEVLEMLLEYFKGSQKTKKANNKEVNGGKLIKIFLRCFIQINHFISNIGDLNTREVLELPEKWFKIYISQENYKKLIPHFFNLLATSMTILPSEPIDGIDYYGQICEQLSIYLRFQFQIELNDEDPKSSLISTPLVLLHDSKTFCNLFETMISYIHCSKFQELFDDIIIILDRLVLAPSITLKTKEENNIEKTRKITFEEYEEFIKMGLLILGSTFLSRQQTLPNQQDSLNEITTKIQTAHFWNGILDHELTSESIYAAIEDLIMSFFYNCTSQEVHLAS